MRKARQLLITITTACCFLCLTGCATRMLQYLMHPEEGEIQTVQMYKGQRLAKDQEANMVWTYADVGVTAVDKLETDLSLRGSLRAFTTKIVLTQMNLVLRPGLCNIEVGYSNGRLKSVSPIILKLQVLAGHSYRPNCTLTKEPPQRWFPYIEDITSGEPVTVTALYERSAFEAAIQSAISSDTNKLDKVSVTYPDGSTQIISAQEEQK